ncbi:MAG TPA: diguanylate cyclase [Gammaproteobacteria bacterium]|nr:diguanylate cyclase [Gammaproteobacteria bacterium]
MTETLSEKHALAIVSNCPFPVLVMDSQSHVLNYNHAFEQLVGRDQASDLLGHEYSKPGDHPLGALLGREKSVCWTDGNKSRHYFKIHFIDLEGEARAQARLFIDVTEQTELEQSHAKLSEELKQHVLTDTITGLLNWRGLVLALEPQVARSRRYNSPMSVIMMEIHCEGNRDRLLLKIARLLKDQLRWADLIGCSEHHEFVLVLPETTAESAVQLADKLEQRLADMGDATDGQNLSICYGITGWRRKDSAGTLLNRAGMSLSEARSRQDEHSIAL